MNGLTPVSMVSIVSAATFFFATAISLNLAVAIYRRSEKSFVVDNLVVILLILAVESAISLSYGIYGTVHGIDEKARYLLASGAFSAQIAAVAVIVWFILSATRRMICDRDKFPSAPVLLAIARSKALHWFLALAIFGSAGVAAGAQIWRMFSIMGSGEAGRIQMPPLFLKNPAGMVIGFLGGIGILTQFLTIVYARYRSMQGQKKIERMRRVVGWKPQERVTYFNSGSRDS